MSYVDKNYYYNNFYGTLIPESDFNKKASEASSKVNYYTLNRITKDILDDNIRNATCEIAELIYSQDILKEKVLNDDKIKTSEAVGPHSIGYANNKTLQEKYVLTSDELENECYKICYRYLANTGLMYRGVY